MLQYRIPATLAREIDDLERRIAVFCAGTISGAELKAFRVPFGIYEQRVKGLYMARIRCAAGIIAPAQLGAAAGFAAEFGSGTLHITTRQELQVHDVPIEKLVPLLRALADIGLSTRGGGGNTVRNITASWDAGIAKDEPFDVTPHAVELTSRLIFLHDSWMLPRKFKIAFSNSAADTAFATVNDAGFVAAVKNGSRGFRVFAAGGLGRSPRPGLLLHDFVPEHEVFEVAEALKRLFSKYGNRRNKHAARLRFLRERLGGETFVELYRKERDALEAENSAQFRPEVSEHPRPFIAAEPERPADVEASTRWRQRYVTDQRQEGFCSVRIPLLLGNISAGDAAALAGVLLPFGDDSIRFTQDQNIVVRNIPEHYLGTLFNISRRVAPLSGETPLFGSAVACAGASTCQLGICRSCGALSAAVEHLRGTGIDLDALGEFRLHISGCTNSCGQHPIADLGFTGRAGTADGRRYPMYTVYGGASIDALNGTRLAEKAGEIPARDLPVFVERLLVHYLSKKALYGTWRGYFSAEGLTYVNELCIGFNQVGTYRDAPEYYRDFNNVNDFSLEGRGAGECAAGLFDLVDIDIAKLRALRRTIGVADDTGVQQQLFELAFTAARALLITRGIEAADDVVFGEFRRQFIDGGPVASRFALLIDALRADPGCSAARAGEIVELADAVETLYASMDDTLQFHPESAASVPPPVRPDAQKDLRNVACPMNFVKAKMALAKLETGQLLGILLDDGAPIDNVPRSVETEGHTVISREKSGGHWTVVVRKGP